MEAKPLISKTNIRTARCLSLAVLASIAGCSATSSPNYASLGLVQVSGTATLDGVPLSGVEVRLENVEESIYSYGVTDDSGRFSLMFDSRTPGIIPGRKLVRVVAKRKSESERAGPAESDAGTANEEKDGEEEGGAVAAPSPATIPDCYGKQSGYFVQIEGGTSNLALELRSDCSNVEKSN